MKTKLSLCLIGLILLANLAACSPGQPDPGPAPTATLAPSATWTTAPAASPTLQPTSTPTLTETPPPTLTPTPPLLVLPGTPLPPAEQVITFDNAGRVSGLATWQERTVTDLEWTPDGLLLAVANTVGINFYDVQTRQALRSLYPSAEGIVDITFSPGGSWLVAGSRRGSEAEGYASNLELWLGPDWRPMGILYGMVGALTGLSFSGDGRYMAVSYASPQYYDNSVDIWNSYTWGITDTVQTGTALDVAFSPSEEWMAITPDRYAIRVWDMKNRKWLYRQFTSFTGAVNCMAFSPDGYILATGHYDGTIRLWDMRMGDLILTIQSDEVIESLAFSPDGRLLASGGSYQDNQVRLWSAGSGLLLQSLDGHSNGVTSLAFAPQGQYLASASYNGEIYLWGLRP